MAAFSQTRNAVVRWVLRVVLALGSRDIPRLGVEVFIVGRRAVGQVSRRVTVNKSTVNKAVLLHRHHQQLSVLERWSLYLR